MLEIIRWATEQFLESIRAVGLAWGVDEAAREGGGLHRIFLTAENLWHALHPDIPERSPKACPLSALIAVERIFKIFDGLLNRWAWGGDWNWREFVGESGPCLKPPLFGESADLGIDAEQVAMLEESASLLPRPRFECEIDADVVACECCGKPVVSIPVDRGYRRLHAFIGLHLSSVDRLPDEVLIAFEQDSADGGPDGSGEPIQGQHDAEMEANSPTAVPGAGPLPGSSGHATPGLTSPGGLKPRSLAVFAAELLALYEPPFRSGPTREKLRQVLGQVMQLPGVETVTDLTPATVGAWVRTMIGRGLSRATIDGYLSNLRSACSYAVRRGYLPSNPVECRDQWLPHGYEGRPAPVPLDAPTAEQMTGLLNLLLDRSITWEGHRLFALVMIVAYAGLRRNEALNLRWEHCDIADRIFRVMSAPLARRVRPMPAKIAEVLDRWRPHCDSEWVIPHKLLTGPWTGGPPGQKPIHRLRDAGQMAGIDHLSFERLGAFWSSQLERVHLPGFEDRPSPLRYHRGPLVKKPGPPPSRATVLDLSRGPDYPPLVRGEPLSRLLTLREFEILKAMMELGCHEGQRVTEAVLAERSGHPNPVRTLRELRKVPPLESVIAFPGPGGKGRGYGLTPR